MLGSARKKGLIATLLAVGALVACDGAAPDGRRRENEAGSSGEAEAGDGGTAGNVAGGTGGDSGNAGAPAAGRGGMRATGGGAGRDAAVAGGEAGDGGEGGGAGNVPGTGGRPQGKGGSGPNGGSSGTSSSGGAGTGAGGSAGTGGDAGMGGLGPTCAKRCFVEHGANACGEWTCTASGECRLADCEDGDHDGYGVGAACTCPLDCDDRDGEVTVSKTAPCCRTGSGERSCTNGVWGACSAGTPATAEACDGEDDDCDGIADNDLGTFRCGLGVCAVTVPACVNGAVSACVPSTPTSSWDWCNGFDDDCDGITDEDCIDCIKVTPTGDDALDLPERARTPFRNVQPAIDFAHDHPGGPSRVCVAAGPTCGLTASYPGPQKGDLRMRNGVNVTGGFESSTWTLCSNGSVRLEPQTGRGVVFGSDVVNPTSLDAVAIARFAADVTSGVTVDGAHGVTLSNLEVLDGPRVDTSYGVNVTNGGIVTIQKSRIDAGQATREGIGVRSFESRVSLEDNCPAALDARGRCAMARPVLPPPPPVTRPSCDDASIRGPHQVDDDLLASFAAVLFDSSPGSRIERSSLCSTTGDYGRVDTVRVRGDATGIVIRGDTIDSITYADDHAMPHGLRLEDCAGASPWVVDNASLRATNATAVVGAYGDCHPVIDSNDSIAAHLDIPGSTVAVICGTPGRIPSLCVLSKNSIQADFEVAPWMGPVQYSGTGVTCTGCPKISQNHITGLSGPTVYSFMVFASGTGLVANGDSTIERNWIGAGCSSGHSLGMQATGNLTIENNVITGNQGRCGGSETNGLFTDGLIVRGENVNVHSNHISNGFGGDSKVSVCVGAGVKFGGASNGVFRNNRIRQGCHDAEAAGFIEENADADPRVFENNGLYDELGGYRDDTGRLNSSQVNLLTDRITGGNIRDRSTAVRLTSTSECRDRGTKAGAPRLDIDGELRDEAPDIGPDEFTQ